MPRGCGMPCGWQTGCGTSCQTGLKIIAAKGQGEEEEEEGISRDWQPRALMALCSSGMLCNALTPLFVVFWPRKALP